MNTPLVTGSDSERCPSTILALIMAIPPTPPAALLRAPNVALRRCEMMMPKCFLARGMVSKNVTFPRSLPPSPAPPGREGQCSLLATGFNLGSCPVEQPSANRSTKFVTATSRFSLRLQYYQSHATASYPSEEGEGIRKCQIRFRNALNTNNYDYTYTWDQPTNKTLNELNLYTILAAELPCAR